MKHSYFKFPSTIYGREKELTMLFSTLRESSNRESAVILLSGHSGVGKTTLIKELASYTDLMGGCFANGKYDAVKPERPYDVFLKAMGQLVGQLLNSEPGHIWQLKKELSNALHGDLNMEVKFSPGLEVVLKPNEGETANKVLEKKSRIAGAIRRLFCALASMSPLLVLGLDDMQWMDLESLDLIEECLPEEARGILLVGTYRSYEVEPGEAVDRGLQRLRRRGVIRAEMQIPALQPESVNQLIADALHMEPDRCRTLAELVFRKTAGTPFFIHEFLNDLLQKGLLDRTSHGEWFWNIAEIEPIEATENVMTLTARKVAGLSLETKKLISVGAAFGNQFHARDLSGVLELSVAHVQHGLMPACSARILNQPQPGIYGFFHDRLQESAYRLFSQEELIDMHLRIGRMLLQEQGNQPWNKSRLFDAVSHMNRGKGRVGGIKARNELAKLNYLVGCDSLDAGAFAASHIFFTTGLELLATHCWHTHYELALNLHVKAGQTAVLTGEPDLAFKLAELIKQKAENTIGKIAGYEIHISAAVVLLKANHALMLVAEALALLTCSVIIDPTPNQQRAAARETLGVLKQITALPFEKMEVMTRPDQISAMRLMMLGIKGAGFSNYGMYWILVAQMAELSLTSGRSSMLPVAIVAGAGMICNLLQEHAFAGAVARQGLKMCRRQGYLKEIPFCLFVFYQDVKAWEVHPRILVAGFTATHRLALKHGDSHTAVYSLFFGYLTAFFSGMQLKSLGEMYLGHSKSLFRIRAHGWAEILESYHHCVKGLMGEGGGLYQAVPLPLHLTDEHESLLCREMMVQCLMGDWHGAATTARRAMELPGEGTQALLPTGFYITLSLLRYALSPDRHETAQASTNREIAVKNGIRHLKQRAKQAPKAYEHRLSLVKGLQARQLGDIIQALRHCCNAIDQAFENNFYHEEALAAELAADFHLKENRNDLARPLLIRAGEAYARWGCRAKVAQLSQRFPEIFQMHSSGKETLLGKAGGDVLPIGDYSITKEEHLDRALKEVSRLRQILNYESLNIPEPSPRSSRGNTPGGIVGESRAIRRVLSLVEQVAEVDATVLITGESGTGKELVAKAIHQLSLRRNHPLIKVNCAALPSDLIESELFGHEKGAFTGAIQRKKGRFELADRGTIFLDEIGEMPLKVQGKLLRVLQEKEFEPVGSGITRKVDVRVVAATNREMQKALQQKVFREDLFYRISVFPITMPPLRDRKEDVPLLTWHFITQKQTRMGRCIEVIPDHAMTSLLGYHWPGNVRELENLIERALIVSRGKVLGLDASWYVGNGKTDTLPTEKRDKLKEMEFECLAEALAGCNWKVSGPGGAAEQLGIKPNTLRYKMKKYGLKKPSPIYPPEGTATHWEPSDATGFETRVARWGNSLAVRIPKALADSAGIKSGDSIDFIVNRDKEIVLRCKSLLYSFPDK